jgi:hypothetical protein
VVGANTHAGAPAGAPHRGLASDKHTHNAKTLQTKHTHCTQRCVCVLSRS